MLNNNSALIVVLFFPSAERILVSPPSEAPFLFVCLQRFPVQKPQGTLEGLTGDLETIPLNAVPLVLQKRMEKGERGARRKKPVPLTLE